MRKSSRRWHILRGIIVAALAMCFGLATTGTASAQAPDCAGRGVPVSKISIQLWTFAEYVGFGTDAATIARLEEVLSSLSEMGYRNVEPFTLSGLSAEDYRALLDKYGLKASARHVNVGTRRARRTSSRSWRTTRRWASSSSGPAARRNTPPRPSGSPTPSTSTISVRWRAAGADPDGAQPQLGVPDRVRGPNRVRHPHAVHRAGERRFQLDLYWATNGGGLDNPVEVLERYGNRIQLFHVKDMAAGPFPGRIEIVGEGIIDFPEIFAATQGPVRYYVVEHDPRFGDPTFDPFEAAEKGFAYLDCVTY